MANGHSLSSLLECNLSQIHTLHAATLHRRKYEGIELLSLIRLGSMYSRAEKDDFVKLLKEIEYGD